MKYNEITNNINDSLLTRLLQSSLGGKTKTMFIFNASSNIINRDETILNLKFGSRCRLIQNKISKNKILNNADLTKKLTQLQFENDSLKERLNNVLNNANLMNNNGSPKNNVNSMFFADNNSSDNNNNISNDAKELQLKIAELETRIEELLNENSDLNNLVTTLKSQKLKYQETEHDANEGILCFVFFVCLFVLVSFLTHFFC